MIRDTIISCADVSKDFAEIEALKDINLEIQTGEVCGIIGPDGAGKTTLFRLITSLLIPDTGTISVLGFDSVKEYREIRKNLGYMPGRFSLYPDLSVEENLSFYASVYGSSIKNNYHLHTIVATATDSSGAPGSDEITLNVNGPPDVSITSPAAPGPSS